MLASNESEAPEIEPTIRDQEIATGPGVLLAGVTCTLDKHFTGFTGR